MTTNYETFIKTTKIRMAEKSGFDVSLDEINPICKPFQKLTIQWAVCGGRRALFKAFGLGKTIDQIEIVRLTLLKSGCRRGLIVIPLGVKQEFRRDAKMLGVDFRFIQEDKELSCNYCGGTGEIACSSTNYQTCPECAGDGLKQGIFFTNYESIREKKLNVKNFDVISLDEAACLRSFGSKTFSEFLFGPAQSIKYRFVATATPSPNEYQELLAYAHFLGIMDIGQARTRFFKRNSEKSDDLTLHKHKEREFWLWVSSWGLFLEKPSDICGHNICQCNAGYELPELKVNFHELKVDHNGAPPDKSGQGVLFKNAALGVTEASRAKRETLELRIAKMKEIIAASPDENFIIWHDLEDERKAIIKELPEAKAVYGAQKLDLREEIIVDFADGKTKYLAGKPQMLGSGPNLQRHCHRAIFLGIGYKFNDFIQAIHRIHRFLQGAPVVIDIIYAESEKLVLQTLQEKWERHKEQVRVMTEIIQKYGLSSEAMAKEFERAYGIDRIEISGDKWKLICNDAVLELKRFSNDFFHLICTSIPFANQYEYSENLADFGHSESLEHFFEQMDFLTPHLFRTLSPGRLAVIHVKDRIVPKEMTGLGFQTVCRFHSKVADHFEKHGFGFLGMQTLVTDVVRENNQTYRLGYSEQCADGSKMGRGMSEYLLYFRKPPTDLSNMYADIPVEKSKDQFSLAKWQVEASGYFRTAGDRLLNPDDIKDLPWQQVYRLYKKFSLSNVYDFDHHVRIGEALRLGGRLPTDFMLIPAQSWDPMVWTDVTRMRTLNASQATQGKIKHICPFPLDIPKRVIELCSMPGEKVLDPFVGIGSTVVEGIKLGRECYGIDLNRNSIIDASYYCKAAEQKLKMPSLFDLLEEVHAPEAFELEAA